MSKWTNALAIGDMVVLRKWGTEAEYEGKVVRVGKMRLVVEWQDGARKREAEYLRSSGTPYGRHTNATLLRKAK